VRSAGAGPGPKGKSGAEAGGGEDEAFAAEDEEEERHGVTAKRRRKIIKEIYKAGTEGARGPVRQDVLRGIRDLEHGWLMAAASKSEYQESCRNYLEQLYS
jgi:hypothetical protein